MDEAVNIANEIDRQGFMFEHGIREAPELADMDAHNQRVLYRQQKDRRREFSAIFRRNVYACHLGLDIQHNFYKNIYSYKKPLYKIRKGEDLLAMLTNTNVGSNFQ